ncbi:MAG: hypothetical protein NT117_05035 [Gammaproteobacteria bacterium]|nr:hypothetical protein [Gammaproteobacteria bacterium]
MLLMTEDAQPVLHCGICDTPILHPDLAMVAYPAGIRHGHLHRVTLSHEGECQRKALEYLDGDHGKAESMTFPLYAARLLAAVPA